LFFSVSAEPKQPLNRDIQEFALNTYTNLHTKLTEGDSVSAIKGEKNCIVGPFSLTVYGIVTCIELLLWAVGEDNGG
jgi:hypothetical protein